MAALQDHSLMPFGKYKDKEMIEVPAEYLLWLYNNNRCNADVKAYVEDNMDVLKEQANTK